MGPQPWPFLMINTGFFTPAPYLTLEGEVQTLQMELDLSLSLLLSSLVLDSLTSITCLSIFLATGTENQELSLMLGVTSSHWLRS